MALKVLETLRRGPRPVASEALPNMPNIDGQPSVQGKPATSGMNEWLRILGYSVLNISFCSLPQLMVDIARRDQLSQPHTRSRDQRKGCYVRLC